MMHVISLIISLLATAVGATISTLHRPVIYGGHETPVDKYKFIASMRSNYTGEHHCGGSLIAPHFILTAAHCHSVELKIDYIVIGSHYNNPNVSVSNVRAVKRVTIHPKYNGEEIKNDFAIVELSEPVLDIKPVLLSLRKEEKYGEMATSMGWGRINQYKQSKVLKEEEFKLISPNVCLAKWNDATRRVHPLGKFGFIQVVGDVSDSVLCVLTASDGNSTCNGDSGGPLVRNKDAERPLLIGVTSFVSECGLNDAPLGFSRVSFARDFIDQHSKGHEWKDDTPSLSDTVVVSYHPILMCIWFFYIIIL